jgi:hypothetical protein
MATNKLLGLVLYEATQQQQQQLAFDFAADQSDDVSKTPLYDAFEEEVYLQPATFEDLAKKQVERLGSERFSWKRVKFTPEKMVYVTSTSRGKRVYDVDKGNVSDGISMDDFFGNITMFDRLHEFFVEDLEAKFNNDFWAYPVTLYHGSGDIESVLQTGIEPRSETRGLNNRSVGDAVFCTSNVEIAESYGDVVAIDTVAMARDGLKPFAAQEPEILESEMLGTVSHKLGAGDQYSAEINDTSIDPDTVILYGAVPAKYLRKL